MITEPATCRLRKLKRPVSRLVLFCTTGALAQAPAESPDDFSDPKFIGLGQVIFARKCSVGYCHGKGGRAGRGSRLRGRIFARNYLFKVIRQGIPNTSMAGWSEKLSREEIRSVVAYIGTLADLQPGASEAPLTLPPQTTPAAAAPNSPIPKQPPQSSSNKSFDMAGDPAKGKELYFDLSDELNCAGCHKINGKGTGAGPDLGGVAEKSPREILQDIVLPSALVPQAGQLFEMTTRNGERLEVVRAGESTTRTKVYVVSTLPPVLRSIKKEQILSLQLLQRSAMPETYGQRYTLQQLLDLISFLKSSTSESPRSVTLQDLF